MVCELDKDVAGEILGWKLPAWQALLLHRVMPSCGGLVIYLIVICYDLALVYEQFQNNDNTLSMFCLIIMVMPALLSLVFTLASPPPGLQTEESAFTVKIKKTDLLWIVKEFLSALFFPIAAIGRYCYLIFWWIEAVCASRMQDEARTREAIARARAPSSMELYLFLQAFIHCAPYAVINILDMLARYSSPDFDKINLQAVSLIASSLRMASTATMYRRFEREKLCGRKYPWGNEVENQEKTSNEDDIDQTNNNDQHRISYGPIMKQQSISSQKENEDREQANSDLIQFSPRSSEIQEPFYDDYIDSDSDMSSEDFPPVTRNENYDSDDEYVRPISIIDRVAPRRRDTQYTIEIVDVPPPPAEPAPRPGSLAVWAEKLVENAESIPTWLSAPPRRKHWEVIQDEPDIPRRVPRTYLRGDVTISNSTASEYGEESVLCVPRVHILVLPYGV
ncbi:jg27697 [Pararge aegeria aegeria]|uniref:XK-related protein n=1 Tax=Pararge aegeria aegeria TaxID=348720 RepID=A0A8S4R8H0_9NEOP|nr:jg27697 [Pararge aegeria aegeria]